MDPTTNDPRWALLTNHAHVLMCIAARPDSLIRELAAECGITERATSRILHDLEEAGFVSHERIGRRNRYHVNTEQRSPHPREGHLGAAEIATMAPPQAAEREAS